MIVSNASDAQLEQSCVVACTRVQQSWAWKEDEGTFAIDIAALSLCCRFACDMCAGSGMLTEF